MIELSLVVMVRYFSSRGEHFCIVTFWGGGGGENERYIYRGKGFGGGGGVITFFYSVDFI